MWSAFNNFLTGTLTLFLSVTSFVTEGVGVAFESLNTPLVADTAVSLQLNADFSGVNQSGNSYLSLETLLSGINGNEEVASEEKDEALQVSETVEVTEKENLAEAIVNIYCTHRTDEYLRNISGTGFFVSEKGVIMTNAHVAQFLVLESLPKYGEVKCTVRTGEEAASAYEVELLYISPSWVIEHAAAIKENAPKGTGQNDFALLYVTKAVDGGNLPQSFTHLEVDTEYLPIAIKDQTVVIVGYPKVEGVSNKYAVRQVATTTVPAIYTFGSRYVDLFTLSGTPIGAQGASGGPVIGATGKVIGMISTRADDEKYGSGSLQAITTSYIQRTLEEEIDFGLEETISGDLANRANIFGQIMTPILTGLFADQL